jgi:hypothetical protein
VTDLKLIEDNEYEYRSMAFAGEEPVVVAGQSLGGSRASGRVFVGSVAYSNDVDHAEVSRSKRTRWLTFVNERGSVVMAPGVRTHQLSLLLGMGKDWYSSAMVLPEDVAEAVRDEATRIVAENTVQLIGAPL